MEEIKFNKDLEVTEDMVSALISGRRPEGMGYEEFRIKRKALAKFLKARKRGRFFYVSKEKGKETIDGVERDVIKSYGPYKKSNNN
jgi:hypothetical protein